ncbi:MAG: pyrroline-5-carboxylate reductase [Treponema sp.]|nr:pyrroline-5-carboxylate reductase [Treponema sp.]
MKIACIGTGAMGGAIIRSVSKKYDVKNITVTDKNTEAGKAFAAETGVNFTESNIEVLKDADFAFIAVKPQFLKDVFDEIKGYVEAKTVLISMAAGVKIEKLKEYCPEGRFVRMMPNVCAQIGQAMTAVTKGEGVSQEEFNTAKEILSAAGVVEEVPEKLMDCVTAVSGSGPAFVFMFIEALADAAVRCGMPRAQAYTYAAQTVKGSAALVMETKKHPAVLKDSVCSPAGTTIEGVKALEENGFRNSVIQAVCAANDRSAALGK